MRDIKYQFSKELSIKQDAMERLEGLRMELKMVETNEGSMSDVWKTKCKELVEITNNIKNENDLLRIKLTHLTLNLQ